MIPQNLDVWAWEKYYKQESPGLTLSDEVMIVTPPPASSRATAAASEPEEAVREEEDGEPGIFSRKELLTPGESVLDWVGNRTERQVLAGLPVGLGVGVRIENWSRLPLTQPQVITSYGKQSSYLPVTEVRPGVVEFCVLEQDQGATGVSAVIRWHIGDTDSVLSLMLSVPYSLHLWSAWAAVGLTKDAALPDFSAMYSGTPDSAWFVRREMGRRMEFSDGELILVVESDASTAKPVVRLSVVPLKSDQVAKSIQYRSVIYYERIKIDGDTCLYPGYKGRRCPSRASGGAGRATRVCWLCQAPAPAPSATAPAWALASAPRTASPGESGPDSWTAG